MRHLGLEPDPWQVEVLDGNQPRLLLNCSRQAGKSTAVAMLGLYQALSVPFTIVLLVSRSHRQSTELYRVLLDFHRRLGSPMLKRRTTEELQLDNFSRVVCLPCREETIRGYSNVSLLIIDEAARVPDDLYRAVRPMLAVSNGRLICLSTPYGKRGFFYEAWAKGGDDWARIEVPAERISRITPEFLAQERRAMGELWFRQEYGCSFEALEGLVYPDFARCVVPGPAPLGRRVGGIDFGLRNPFAAVWGVLDRDDNLWLTGEHYSRNKTLAFHAGHLPRDVTWYGDPAGAREIVELRCAGLCVRKGHNEKKPGIAAVRARLEDGSLRVVAGACPNLLAEAALYRYDPDSQTEEPVTSTTTPSTPSATSSAAPTPAASPAFASPPRAPTTRPRTTSAPRSPIPRPRLRPSAPGSASGTPSYGPSCLVSRGPELREGGKPLSPVLGGEGLG
jgi:hypothetical protein